MKPDAVNYHLPTYLLTQTYTSRKQSSFDRTGANRDWWAIPAGGTQEIFRSDGPGVITHLWFTMGHAGEHHLKEVVLRMFWDNQTKPSVEVPIGDFFGLNLGQYNLYQSAFLNCASVRGLNSYFGMPFRKSARMTVTNEGKRPVGNFYSNIDYQLMPSLPDEILYFHAQYRQATPTTLVRADDPNADPDDQRNLGGKGNYVFVETRGQGHLLGVTLGVLQNRDLWMGEGDDMTFIDDEATPVITGTGCEDYFNGAHDFAAGPFAYLYHGAHLISAPELAGGRYCLYRWHAESPITFRKYMKHTMESGHANDRDDCYYSVAYWYQAEPYTDFPQLPDVEQRVARLKVQKS